MLRSSVNTTTLTRPFVPAAVAHGGAGSDPTASDGCRTAVDKALQVLAASNDPVMAAAAAVVILEDDPRFNAGTGSVVRLDGSVQMDASVMSSDGRFSAVAGLERVKNPVLVAQAVRDTPHLLIAGDGATAFARALGHPDHDPVTPERAHAAEVLRERLATADPSLVPFWQSGAFRQRWNYPLSLAALGLDARDVGCDTVGVVVRASDGRFAAALSTGGTSIMLRGRVGDVPIYGAGLFASAAGAAAATGTGERITEALLAKSVVDWLAAGVSAAEAAQRAIDLLRARADVGMIVVTPTELAAAASGTMAWAGRSADAPWD
jgi:beta-aspartyl-peptidase (threonine type)